MRECDHCSKETSNPRFCSKSCSAKKTNMESPRRKMTKFCKNECGTLIPSSYTYCSKKCNYERRKLKTLEQWDNTTLGEMIGVGNANAGSRYPYIRELARRRYLESSMPKKCLVCGYSKHFDVCHLIAVSDHELKCMVNEVNSLKNLVAMCKNHHWEYDHGSMSDEDLDKLHSQLDRV